VIVAELVRRGARVQANDPVAMAEARRCLAMDGTDLGAVSFHEQPMQALQGADALVIATEWKAYRSQDFQAIKTALKAPVIFDGRNLY
jgi:UDPglucose 6-dehydrogenase